MVTIIYIATIALSIITTRQDLNGTQVNAMSTIDTIRLSPQRTKNSAFRASPGDENILARLWRAYCTLAAKRRSRLELGDLSVDQLKDIGVTEAEARREAAIPFWR
ncbi:uncharacterized protein YjiS (DUF1127 family) [Sinorhizobium fredii]|jgi:uncharacterized protein YjiS (DUF1127 family)|uniref:DUF1127 domain-containing protein n=1 Tax=Sinorhizobium TaxID=28105 RepID=UPI00059C94A5|nr:MULTISPECIES: DUF1127 domain-containing protein [Sinorhizobium]